MVSIGGVNVVQALVEAEIRLLVLEKVVETMLKAGIRTERLLNLDLGAIREQAVKDLQVKYPGLGIKAPGG
jgi:hypothetical protein